MKFSHEEIFFPSFLQAAMMPKERIVFPEPPRKAATTILGLFIFLLSRSGVLWGHGPAKNRNFSSIEQAVFIPHAR